MTRAGIEHRDGPPAWAAIGAPLVGVPLLVMLLAVATPADRAPASEPDGAARTEALEVQPADADLDPDRVELDGTLREG